MLLENANVYVLSSKSNAKKLKMKEAVAFNSKGREKFYE